MQPEEPLCIGAGQWPLVITPFLGVDVDREHHLGDAAVRRHVCQDFHGQGDNLALAHVERGDGGHCQAEFSTGYRKVF